MLKREADWFDFFKISKSDQKRGKELSEATLGPSAGMMDVGDLHALAAALLYHKPAKIFEIGTYMGASSNFFLTLLPKVQVISIAYISPSQLSAEAGEKHSGARYNNDELGSDRVGSLVTAENRPRFTQLIGDSHQIVAKDFLSQHGKMDFVFIDGDHSRKGVAEDTELAKQLITAKGAIGWHDANPKKKYIDSRLFLEEDLDLTALATADTYIGGVAFWTEKLEKRLMTVKTAS